MTTIELRNKQILCMLGVKEEDYTKEELETILDIGEIIYNLQEMENLLKNHEK